MRPRRLGAVKYPQAASSVACICVLLVVPVGGLAPKLGDAAHQHTMPRSGGSLSASMGAASLQGQTLGHTHGADGRPSGTESRAVHDSAAWQDTDRGHDALRMFRESIPQLPSSATTATSSRPQSQPLQYATRMATAVTLGRPSSAQHSSDRALHHHLDAGDALKDGGSPPHDPYPRHAVSEHRRDVRELPYGSGPHQPVKRFDQIAEIAQHSNGSTFEFFNPPQRAGGADGVWAGAAHNISVEAVRVPDGGGDVSGYMSIAADPVATFSVYEPGHVGGCTDALPPTLRDGRTTVSTSGRAYGCEVAVNAGFFDTSNGQCHGNIVSNGRIVQANGAPNANFGLLANGSIVVGYLNNSMIRDIEPPFVQLVAGVVWLVRNGTNYVSEAVALEYGRTQEGGIGLGAFSSLVSARVAIGHDAEGRVMIIQVNGKTNQRGIDLYTFADVLIANGIVNAINLDGGGSATTATNGTVVSEPSDECPTTQCELTRCPMELRGRSSSSPPIGGYTDCESWCRQFKCERRVTTVVCLHSPICYDCISQQQCETRPCTTTTTSTTATTRSTLTTLSTTSTTQTGTTLTGTAVTSTSITTTTGEFVAHSQLQEAQEAAAKWRAGFTALVAILVIVLLVATTVAAIRRAQSRAASAGWASWEHKIPLTTNIIYSPVDDGSPTPHWDHAEDGDFQFDFDSEEDVEDVLVPRTYGGSV
eukprot:m.201056 g.201056  ORF g.201056 m.201056 type:complete len:704 (-) comp21293_c0_seq1:63-2174(-)